MGIGKISRIFPDIYIRDTIQDIGDPHSGSSSQSPDIIVRNKEIENPHDAFGEYSNTLNNSRLSDDVEYGNTNYIYVRVFNRSAIAATNSTLDVYYSKPSSLCLPNDWIHIGSIKVPFIPPFGFATVSRQIEWDNIPWKGHYCFIATIHNFFDPGPNLKTISKIPDFHKFIQKNNNTVWRNFNVVNNKPDSGREFNSYNFIVRGSSYERKERLSLEICTNIPEGGNVWLSFDSPLTMEIHNKCHEKENIEKIPIHYGCNKILEEQIIYNEVIFTINYFIPDYLRNKDYYIFSRQLYQGTEIGRITWDITTK